MFHTLIKASQLITLCIFFVFEMGNSQTRAINFPDDFFGNYAGTLNIYNDKGSTPYAMEFKLHPTDSPGQYTYTIIYGEDENKQERPYSLKVVNMNLGKYVVDENNGIILDQKVIDNRMYSIFEVAGNLLTTFLTFEEDHMIFEIVVTKLADKNRTGGISGDIPEVFSYPVNAVKRAVLLKQR